MDNPWLEIPAADYEGHMAAPEVGQLQALNLLFKTTLERYRPHSVAVLGCCTGNGFEHIDGAVTRRVLGIDINGAYLDVLRERHSSKIDGLEIFQHDIAQAPVPAPPVDLLFGALVFEYLPIAEAWRNLRALVRRDGILIAALQMPSDHSSTITETGYESLKKLAPIMNLVDPEEFGHFAGENGFRELRADDIPLKQGKRLFVGYYVNSA